MSQHGLVKKVFNNSYDITNLGAILFAKNLNDFPTVKRKSIRVVLYKGNTRVDRMREQEGILGYAIAFENLLDYINDKLPHNEEISKALRKDVKMYPEVAIPRTMAWYSSAGLLPNSFDKKQMRERMRDNFESSFSKNAK